MTTFYEIFCLPLPLKNFSKNWKVLPIIIQFYQVMTILW